MRVSLQLIPAIAIGVLAGCSEAQVETRGSPVGLAVGASVSVSASEALESNSTVSCVADALSAQEVPLRVVSAKQFRRTVFEDTAIQTDGKSLAERLMALKNDAVLRDRVAKLGLRHMILVDRPETVQEFDDFYCEGGYFGAICGAAWDRNSTIRARVIDLHEGSEIGSAAAHVSGRRLLLFPLPLYIPTATEGEACKELAGAISRQLTGKASTG